MATAPILNTNSATAASLTGSVAAPMAASGTGGSDANSAGSQSATITANDFLTLLVTELQNQDPTADTDPNEYINQLVQVNSLEQLININQTLTSALGNSTASTGTASAQARSIGVQAVSANTASTAARNLGVQAAENVTASPSATTSSAAQEAAGNLGIPAAGPSALTVARALDGSGRAHSAAASITVK